MRLCGHQGIAALQAEGNARLVSRYHRTNASSNLARVANFETGNIMHVQDIRMGLYKIHWKSGGSSLASIGITHDGGRWIAPTNWISTAEINQDILDDIKKMEKIESNFFLTT